MSSSDQPPPIPNKSSLRVKPEIPARNPLRVKPEVPERDPRRVQLQIPQRDPGLVQPQDLDLGDDEETLNKLNKVFRCDNIAGAAISVYIELDARRLQCKSDASDACKKRMSEKFVQLQKTKKALDKACSELKQTDLPQECANVKTFKHLLKEVDIVPEALRLMAEHQKAVKNGDPASAMLEELQAVQRKFGSGKSDYCLEDCREMYWAKAQTRPEALFIVEAIATLLVCSW